MDVVHVQFSQAGLVLILLPLFSILLPQLVLNHAEIKLLMQVNNVTMETF